MGNNNPFLFLLQNGENDYPQPLIVTVNLNVKDADWNIYENGLYDSCLFFGISRIFEQENATLLSTVLCNI